MAPKRTGQQQQQGTQPTGQRPLQQQQQLETTTKARQRYRAVEK